MEVYIFVLIALIILLIIEITSFFSRKKEPEVVKKTRCDELGLLHNWSKDLETNKLKCKECGCGVLDNEA